MRTLDDADIEKLVTNFIRIELEICEEDCYYYALKSKYTERIKIYLSLGTCEPESLWFSLYYFSVLEYGNSLLEYHLKNRCIKSEHKEKQYQSYKKCIEGPISSCLLYYDIDKPFLKSKFDRRKFRNMVINNLRKNDKIFSGSSDDSEGDYPDRESVEDYTVLSSAPTISAIPTILPTRLLDSDLLIFDFLKTLSSYERFIFSHHLPHQLFLFSKIKRIFNYYPQFSNDKCLAADILEYIINHDTNQNYWAYVNESYCNTQYGKTDIETYISKSRDCFIKTCGGEKSLSNSMHVFHKMTQAVYQKENDPIKELIFMNIPEIQAFREQIMGYLSIDKEDYYNSTQQSSESKFRRFADYLNSDEKPTWLGDKIWGNLCQDELILNMRKNNVSFTPDDIQTTKARLKERYSIFSGEKGAKAKAPRKKKGKKASS